MGSSFARPVGMYSKGTTEDRNFSQQQVKRPARPRSSTERGLDNFRPTAARIDVMPIKVTCALRMRGLGSAGGVGSGGTTGRVGNREIQSNQAIILDVYLGISYIPMHIPTYC